MNYFWRTLSFAQRGEEPFGRQPVPLVEYLVAIMFTPMFWLNFAGGAAFVLFGATAVVMIGVL